MTVTVKKIDGAEITRTTSIAHLSDATGAAQTYKLGYAPRYVQVVNATDRITLEWYAGMASDSAIKTVAAGTRTLETSGGVKVAGDVITFTDAQSKQFYITAQG